MKKSLYEYALKHGMNRRSFVKGAASAGAIAAMSGGLSSVAVVLLQMVIQNFEKLFFKFLELVQVHQVMLIGKKLVKCVLDQQKRELRKVNSRELN